LGDEETAKKLPPLRRQSVPIDTRTFFSGFDLVAAVAPCLGAFLINRNSVLRLGCAGFSSRFYRVVGDMIN
jgi:hypothetical protein